MVGVIGKRLRGNRGHHSILYAFLCVAVFLLEFIGDEETDEKATQGLRRLLFKTFIGRLQEGAITETILLVEREGAVNAIEGRQFLGEFVHNRLFSRAKPLKTLEYIVVA